MLCLLEQERAADATKMVSKQVQFWTYLIPYIPSVACACFALYHMLFHRGWRTNINNHVPILLLLIGMISQLTVYPWMFHWFLSDLEWERSPVFCSAWGLLDWGMYCTQTILFAWGSMERHILIFHDQWLKKKIHCFILHYLPLIIILLYCSIYYSIMYIFPPHPNTFDSTEMFCVDEYLLNETNLVFYDTIVHQIVPVFAIILFSVLLLARVIWWKAHLRQQNQWRRYRKMTIQLLSIAVLYFVFALPFSLYFVLVLVNVSSDVLDAWEINSNYLTYFPILFTPFVCLASSNQVRRQLKTFLLQLRKKHGTVAPATRVRSVHY